MNVSLTPELEAWVEARVKSGLYGSPSDGVRAALRLLQEFEEAQGRRLADLRDALDIGIADFETGRTVPLDEALAVDVKRVGRRRES